MRTLDREALRDATTSSVQYWQPSPQCPEPLLESLYAKHWRVTPMVPVQREITDHWLAKLATLERTTRCIYRFTTEETDAAGRLLIFIHSTLLPDEEDTSWFDSPAWQEGERRVDEHIRAGRVETFESADDFLADLHQSVAE